jgi:putative endonuclease
MRNYYVYILSSKRNGTLYTGDTNDLERRVYEHKNKLVPGFTSRHEVNKLVYFESCPEIQGAIIREKQLKDWTRKRKLALIESVNPEWKDFADEWS